MLLFCSPPPPPLTGEALNTPGGVITAKLFVTCTSKPTVPPWVFYLRGNVVAAAVAPPPVVEAPAAAVVATKPKAGKK